MAGEWSAVDDNLDVCRRFYSVPNCEGDEEALTST